MFQALIMLATKVAGLLEEKEKNKFIDEILEIKKAIADEELKDNPDDGRITEFYNDLVRISNVLTNTAFTKTS